MTMKEEYTAIDMATAAAEGFRDGQRAAQSAPAGESEALEGVVKRCSKEHGGSGYVGRDGQYLKVIDAALAASTGQEVGQEPVSEIRQRALDLYKPPFKFECGYIQDSKHRMVADQHDGPDSLRVRGWGRIRYMEDPEKLQDEVGALIAEALTEKWAGTATQPAPAQDVAGLVAFLQTIQMTRLPDGSQHYQEAQSWIDTLAAHDKQSGGEV